MRDVVLSQNDMLPVFLVLSKRECMKMVLRLVYLILCYFEVLFYQYLFVFSYFMFNSKNSSLFNSYMFG